MYSPFVFFILTFDNRCMDRHEASSIYHINGTFSEWCKFSVSSIKEDISFYREIILVSSWLIIWKALPNIWNELLAISNFSYLKTLANNVKIKSSLKFPFIKMGYIFTDKLLWNHNLTYFLLLRTVRTNITSTASVAELGNDFTSRFSGWHHLWLSCEVDVFDSLCVCALLWVQSHFILLRNWTCLQLVNYQHVKINWFLLPSCVSHHCRSYMYVGGWLLSSWVGVGCWKLHFLGGGNRNIPFTHTYKQKIPISMK
jgi:hypothetical protein